MWRDRKIKFIHSFIHCHWWPGSRPEIIMLQLVAIILFLNSLKILLLFPKPLLLFSYYSQQITIINACYTATLGNIQHSLEWAKIAPEVQANQSLRTTLNKSTTISVLVLQMSAIITIVQQNGSQFVPHPLLPHAKACYYSRIILNSLPLLLFSKLFRHNYLRPTWQSDAYFLEYSSPWSQTSSLEIQHVWRHGWWCPFLGITIANAACAWQWVSISWNSVVTTVTNAECQRRGSGSWCPCSWNNSHKRSRNAVHCNDGMAVDAQFLE